jgi:hypothetical protein
MQKSLLCTRNADIKLKWPNDVLINGRKVCGVLIEIEKNRMLIGIGCNVGSAPEVAHQATTSSSSSSTSASADATKDIGRPSACLSDFNPYIQEYYTRNESVKPDTPHGTGSPHHSLARNIYHSISGWASAHSFGYLGTTLDVCSGESAAGELPEVIAASFEAVMDFKPQKLRPDSLSQYVKKQAVLPTDGAGSGGVNNYNNSNNNNNSSGSSGESSTAAIYDAVKETERILDAPVITPKGINADGTLRVTFEGSDDEVTLVADYIW